MLLKTPSTNFSLKKKIFLKIYTFPLHIYNKKAITKMCCSMLTSNTKLSNRFSEIQMSVSEKKKIKAEDRTFWKVLIWVLNKILCIAKIWQLLIRRIFVKLPTNISLYIKVFLIDIFIFNSKNKWIKCFLHILLFASLKWKKQKCKLSFKSVIMNPLN